VFALLHGLLEVLQPNNQLLALLNE
jgi:hypothetical protein